MLIGFPGDGWLTDQLGEFLFGQQEEPVRGIDSSYWEAPTAADIESDGLMELSEFFQQISFLFATLLLIVILFTIGSRQQQGINAVRTVVKFVFGLAVIANSTEAIFLLYGFVDSIIMTIQALYVAQTNTSLASEIIGVVYLLQESSLLVNPIVLMMAWTLGYIADLLVIIVLTLRGIVLTLAVPTAPLLVFIWMVGSTIDYSLPGLNMFMQTLFFPIPLAIFLATVEILLAPGSRLAPSLSLAANQLILSTILILGVWLSIKASGISGKAITTTVSAGKTAAFVGAAAVAGGSGAAIKAGFGGSLGKSMAASEIAQNTDKFQRGAGSAAGKAKGAFNNIISNPNNAQDTSSGAITSAPGFEGDGTGFGSNGPGFGANRAVRERPGANQQYAEGIGNPQPEPGQTPYERAIDNSDSIGSASSRSDNAKESDRNGQATMPDDGLLLGDLRERSKQGPPSDRGTARNAQR